MGTIRVWSRGEFQDIEADEYGVDSNNNLDIFKSAEDGSPCSTFNATKWDAVEAREDA